MISRRLEARKHRIHREVSGHDKSRSATGQSVATSASATVDLVKNIAAIRRTAKDLVKSITATGPSVKDLVKCIAAIRRTVKDIVKDINVIKPSVKDIVKSITANGPSVKDISPSSLAGGGYGIAMAPVINVFPPFMAANQLLPQTPDLLLNIARKSRRLPPEHKKAADIRQCPPPDPMLSAT